MLIVGTIVKLKVECLNNPVGTKGIVYEKYQDFDFPDLNGISVIFENGGYDGFSADEQKKFLEDIGFSPLHAGYEFKHVLQVEKDFRAGYWSGVLN